MKLKDSATNLEPLQNAVQNANQEILICSAWIRGETLEKVLNEEIKAKIKTGQLQLKIIIRLGKKIDIEISGDRLFSLIDELGENCQVKYCRNLHTKLYVIDDNYALTGSFNLTGGGFGDKSRKGSNVETGIEYTDPAQVKILRDKFYEIWELEGRLIPSNLLGFTMNEANSSEFYMAGIRELESGKFVELELAENKKILAQVVESIKVNPFFLSYPLKENFADKDSLYTYTHDSELLNTVSGLAESAEKRFSQINIGHVKIKSSLTIEENGDIKQDVNRLAPNVGQEVMVADSEVLKRYFGKNSLKPATLLSNREVEVGFNPEEILSKHMSVFGSTGSGKSYFVKKFIKNYLKDWIVQEDGRIVILDPHGEYADGKDFAGALDENNIFPNVEKIRHFKAKVVDSVDDLKEVCELSRLSAKQKHFLENMIKKSGHKTKKFIELIKKNVEQKPEDSIEVDWEKYMKEPIEEVYHQYLSSFIDLAKLHWQEEKGKGTTKEEKKNYARDKTIEFLDKLPEDIKNSIKQKIIKNQISEFESDFKKDVEPIIDEGKVTEIESAWKEGRFKLESHNFVDKVEEPGLYCMNMSGIDDELQRIEIAGDILRGAFNKAKNNRDKGGFKTLFVVEEAHNFAPERSGKSNPAYRYLKTIASEGRKFGVGIIVISQRPAYVSKDILAQCNSQAIFRLINPNDIKAVEQTVEGISEEELIRLPHYIQGQCIFSGVAINEPVVVKVKE